MARVLHYRLYGLAEHRVDRLHEQFDLLANARAWRCGKPWIASSESRGLFEMEFFRHLKSEESRELSAAGIRFVHPPTKVFWGYGAELCDPDGYRLRLWDQTSMEEKA